jgi:tetratricopeptide (TPR) repeat protein
LTASERSDKFFQRFSVENVQSAFHAYSVMAKQRPHRPSSDVPTSSPSTGHPVSEAAHPERREPPHQERSTAYFEAVALYEKGIEALQRHEYDRAVSVLQAVLRQYPDEKELHERVRLYLSICARQAAPRETAPHTVDERLYAATLAINGGKYDEAISHLRLVRDEDADNDHALYMLAVAHAQRGEHAEAIAHLERAIALNPENRGLARRDPDLEPVRDNEAFRSALDTGGSQHSGIGRRRPIKFRTPR